MSEQDNKRQNADNTQASVNNTDELKKISQSLLDLAGTNEQNSINTNGLTAKRLEPDLTSTSGENELIEPSVLANAYLAQQSLKMQKVTAETKAAYQLAINLMAKQDWPAAIAAFDQVIKSNPELSGAYINKAIIAFKQDDVEQALNWAKQAVTINDKNPYGHNLLGQIYRLKGEFDKAESHYLIAIDIWPDYADAYLNLAVLLDLYRGRLLDAQSFYQAYLDYNPDDKVVNKWLAALNIKIKRAQP